MPRLTGGQRRYLRKQAHHLKPIAHIGKLGLTYEVASAIDQTLLSNELIKVKFLDFQDQKDELAIQLADEVRGELIGVIGNVAILYRESTDPEKRRIVLPGT